MFFKIIHNYNKIARNACVIGSLAISKSLTAILNAIDEIDELIQSADFVFFR